MFRIGLLTGTLVAAVALSMMLSGSRAVTEIYYSHPKLGPVSPPPPIERNFAVSWRPDEALTHLGRKLFFDTRLSTSGATSCARCHDPNNAYAEPRRVSISDNGRPGRRNAPSLLDTAFLPVFMWDGRFRSLEEQVFGPFMSGEMGIGVEEAMRRIVADPQYVHMFQQATGQPPTPHGMARAVAAFERTIVSRESRVDRFIVHDEKAILSPQEQHGYEVFKYRAPCAQCHQLFPKRPDGASHGRPLWTDFRFHNLGVGYRQGGVADLGRYEHTGIKPEWAAFRTPSLRNSAKSPPYMHDGSLATLEEVVEFYNAGGQPNPNLSPLIRPLQLDHREKAALVAFLRALAD